MNNNTTINNILSPNHNNQVTNLNFINHSELKIAQQNLQHSKSATLLFIKMLEEESVDIASIQEPYTTAEKIPGAPIGWRQVTSNTKRASIIIRSSHIPITIIDQAPDSVSISLPFEGNDLLFTSL
ncbi:hypothetical protein CEXT_688641 [Caerostris extrusa]|uniref:Uncharacterized protein n=1 Tax=Caerostris extrusa TaxID=172846 RepID=A0AAV4Q4F9_CAEEX|nr:hypothetical protein CEXT_688641 [Caerostris extrusa]